MLFTECASSYLCSGGDYVISAVFLSLYQSVCVQHYCKSNQPTSLKLGVMIGPTNRKNLLTFGGNPIPDTDSWSLFHFTRWPSHGVMCCWNLPDGPWKALPYGSCVMPFSLIFLLRIPEDALMLKLPLPTFSLLLVVTSHLVLKFFARQLLLFGIVCLLTSVLAKLSQHSADTSNLIFSIHPLPLPSDPSQRLWFVQDYGAL